MASIIPESGVLLNFADSAPAPSKDYCQIIVNRTEVIFRWWKITLRSSEQSKIFPGETKNTHEDFMCDDRTHSEMQRVFGPHMVDYVKALCEGRIDYLPRLPGPILLRIVQFLDLEDISRLACVNQFFRKLCTGDELWEKIYKQNSETQVTDELRSLAEAFGWRKLFFTNKLQLQVQLRRQAKNLKVK